MAENETSTSPKELDIEEILCLAETRENEPSTSATDDLPSQFKDKAKTVKPRIREVNKPPQIKEEPGNEASSSQPPDNQSVEGQKKEDGVNKNAPKMKEKKEIKDNEPGQSHGNKDKQSGQSPEKKIKKSDRSPEIKVQPLAKKQERKVQPSPKIQERKAQPLAKIQESKAKQLTKIQEHKAQQPVKIQESKAEKLTKSSEIKAQSLVKSQESKAQQPVKIEESKAQPLTKIQASKAKLLTKSPEIKAEQLTKIQESKTKQPLKVQESKAKQPPKIQENKTQQLTKSPEIKIQRLAKIQETQTQCLTQRKEKKAKQPAKIQENKTQQLTKIQETEAQCLTQSQEKKAKQPVKIQENKAQQITKSPEIKARSIAKIQELKTQQLAQSHKNKTEQLSKSQEIKAQRLAQSQENKANQPVKMQESKAQPLTKIQESKAKQPVKIQERKAKLLTKSSESNAQQLTKIQEIKGQRLAKIQQSKAQQSAKHQEQGERQDEMEQPKGTEAKLVPIKNVEEEELDQATFNICKKLMRPVKNSLRQLDKPKSRLSDQDLLEQTRSSLLNIGDHIADCLKIHSEPDVLDLWRRNLWVFVAKFIEFNTQKLHKLYKMASQKRAREQEEQKKKEEAMSGKRLRPETPGPSRDIPMPPVPHSPHSQNLQQPSPQPSRIHGHEFMKYHQPNRRDFSHTGRREWQRDPQFNYSWNAHTNWDRNWYQPYEPRWHRDHHYVDCQTHREQYRSSGNYQPSNISRKRLYDPYNSERNYRGQPDYRYCYEAKRQRLDEFRPQNYPEDYQRMSDYRPPLSYHGQGPSDHYRPFHPDKSADYKQLLPPPHSQLPDPRSPPSQKSPLGVRSSIQHRSLLDRPLEQRNNPEYKWSGRKT